MKKLKRKRQDDLSGLVSNDCAYEADVPGSKPGKGIYLCDDRGDRKSVV